MKTNQFKLLFDKKVNVEEKPFVSTFSESCFRITVTAAENLDGGSTVELSIEPESENSYELIVDYKLCLDDSVLHIERDKWSERESIQTITVNSTEVSIRFELIVREILAAQDLTASTSYRNLHILISGRGMYVNSLQLKQLGGKLFKDWYDRECQGESNIVVLSLDERELRVLLETCCSYSSPIIHRRNLDDILTIAEREKITTLLRLAETFLIESETINRIRKLEYAVEYRMSRLADFILRPFSSSISRLDALIEYLSINGENLDQVHKSVLELLEVYPEYMVI